MGKYASGFWPGSLEILQQALAKFSMENSKKPYRVVSPRDDQGEPPNVPKIWTESWGISHKKYAFFESVFDLSNIEAILPRHEWPLAGIHARKLPIGIEVEISWNRRVFDGLDKFIDELLVFLESDGLKNIKYYTIFDVQKLEPWERIPDKGWDQIAVKLWNKNHENSDIAERVGVTPESVTKKLYELRKKYGSEIVPYDTERRKIK